MVGKMAVEVEVIKIAKPLLIAQSDKVVWN
jgi:hypothetical protein